MKKKKKKTKKKKKREEEKNERRKPPSYSRRSKEDRVGSQKRIKTYSGDCGVWRVLSRNGTLKYNGPYGDYRRRDDEAPPHPPPPGKSMRQEN